MNGRRHSAIERRSRDGNHQPDHWAAGRCFTASRRYTARKSGWLLIQSAHN